MFLRTWKGRVALAALVVLGLCGISQAGDTRPFDIDETGAVPESASEELQEKRISRERLRAVVSDLRKEGWHAVSDSARARDLAAQVLAKYNDNLATIRTIDYEMVAWAEGVEERGGEYHRSTLTNIRAVFDSGTAMPTMYREETRLLTRPLSPRSRPSPDHSSLIRWSLVDGNSIWTFQYPCDFGYLASDPLSPEGIYEFGHKDVDRMGPLGVALFMPSKRLDGQGGVAGRLASRPGGPTGNPLVGGRIHPFRQVLLTIPESSHFGMIAREADPKTVDKHASAKVFGVLQKDDVLTWIMVFGVADGWYQSSMSYDTDSGMIHNESVISSSARWRNSRVDYEYRSIVDFSGRPIWLPVLITRSANIDLEPRPEPSADGQDKGENQFPNMASVSVTSISYRRINDPELKLPDGYLAAPFPMELGLRMAQWKTPTQDQMDRPDPKKFWLGQNSYFGVDSVILGPEKNTFQFLRQFDRENREAWERHKPPFPIEELISYEQIIKETMGDVVVEPEN